MNMAKDIPPTVAVHGSVWALPIATEGVQNVLQLIVWAWVLVMLVAGVAAMGGHRAKGEHPPLYKWLLRLSAFGGIAWLAYHGHMIIAPLMLLATFMILFGIAASKGKA